MVEAEEREQEVTSPAKKLEGSERVGTQKKLTFMADDQTQQLRKGNGNGE
jgi:hypothetical protein